MTEPYIDFVFEKVDQENGPSHYAFVEVEDENGKSIKAGNWFLNGEDGYQRLRLKVHPGLNNLAAKINDISTSHGFWPVQGRNMGEMLMLAVSELSEALEEHRSGHPDVYFQLKMGALDIIPGAARPILDRLQELMESNERRANDEPFEQLSDEDHEALVAMGLAKPEGLAVELVDTLIRVLDTLHSRKVDIDKLVALKMSYNNSRPHKHGRAY